jgi:DNA-binding MarR family transcriptional regulator
MTVLKTVGLLSAARGTAVHFLEQEMRRIGLVGLEASHGAILYTLFRTAQKLRMKEIAALINRDKSTVTYLVNGLVNGGYVEREKTSNDARETFIVPTQKSKELEDKILDISDRFMAVAYKGFSEQEQQTLFGLLDRLKNNFLVKLQET